MAAGNRFLIAIDIGAGLGAKMGLFCDPHHQVAAALLRRDQFGDDFDRFVENLLKTLEQLLSTQSQRLSEAKAIGIASPGLFRSDGSYLLAANVPMLTGHNLRQRLAERTGLPVAIENDANAGGLAEWSVIRTALLYWVFGGGWGGAWIDQTGNVRFPALDWNGNDRSLHYTNEPGYAIPLSKLMLKTLFYQFGASFDHFEQITMEEFGAPGTRLTGPGGDPDSIRAEVILSGPGRCRLFRAVVGDDDFYNRFLDIHETRQMTDPSIAGAHISKLSNMRVESAVNTDRLFGQILAQATLILVKQARADALPEGLPICLGGKPSYALPYFGPSAQGRLGALGIMSYMRPSVIDERGLNANLIGAAVLAEKTYSSVTSLS
ncbi:MAG: ROK family protein [Thermoguttaceae bacterium]